MKVKICPECDLQNVEGAWCCEGCGETLSINTLVDLGEAGKENSLAALSRYYEEQALQLQETLAADEQIIGGYNLTQAANQPPYKLGFLIITSERLIRVLYAADKKADSIIDSSRKVLAATSVLSGFGLRSKRMGGNEPMRPSLGTWIRSDSRIRYLALRPPTYPLSETEAASREVITVPYIDIARYSLVRTGSTVKLYVLRLELHDGEKVEFCFSQRREADKTLKIIGDHFAIY